MKDDNFVDFFGQKVQILPETYVEIKNCQKHQKANTKPSNFSNRNFASHGTIPKKHGLDRDVDRRAKTKLEDVTHEEM